MCGASAPPIFGWGCGQNRPTQAKLASSDPEHREEQLDTYFVQAPSSETPLPTFGQVKSALRGKMALPRSSYAATTLRAMAWTSIPPPNKANRTASGDGPAAVSPVGNVNAPATRSTGCKGKASTKWKPRSNAAHIASMCWRDGTIVEIRKFGTSNKARITFAGKEKPRYVHYDNMVVLVRNYYKTIPACGLCGAVGHRADACPNLQPNTGAHATNSRDCAAKFSTPKTAARKGVKKKMAPKKKSLHPALPSDQPRREPSKTDKPAPPPEGGNRLSTASPPQGGPEKPTAATRGRTGA
ncbi:hypothetical protein HPB50_001320 [Hyalomma asiaticum]|uniref:Uncharacterized protein n=1 Tax=Hyalomma asiaticum TaxID=266040 RepID=A0ACB7SSC3_HYAAI|nr:hypothetical protein HPB50_001320 [Hyalomma asiaticum]